MPRQRKRREALRKEEVRPGFEAPSRYYATPQIRGREAVTGRAGARGYQVRSPYVGPAPVQGVAPVEAPTVARQAPAMGLRGMDVAPPGGQLGEMGAPGQLSEAARAAQEALGRDPLGGLKSLGREIAYGGLPTAVQAGVMASDIGMSTAEAAARGFGSGALGQLVSPIAALNRMDIAVGQAMQEAEVTEAMEQLSPEERGLYGTAIAREAGPRRASMRALGGLYSGIRSALGGLFGFGPAEPATSPQQMATDLATVSAMYDEAMYGVERAAAMQQERADIEGEMDRYGLGYSERYGYGASGIDQRFNFTTGQWESTAPEYTGTIGVTSAAERARQEALDPMSPSFDPHAAAREARARGGDPGGTGGLGGRGPGVGRGGMDVGETGGRRGGF